MTRFRDIKGLPSPAIAFGILLLLATSIAIYSVATKVSPPKLLADTTVVDIYPENSFWELPNVAAKNESLENKIANGIALLKFDVPKDGEATLVLYVSINREGTLQVSKISNDWEEKTVNWNTVPSIEKVLVTKFVPGNYCLTEEGLLTIRRLELQIGAVEKGILSLRLDMTDAGFVQFGNKETSNPPELEVV